MSMVRERERTRRTIWIVAGFVLAIAIAAGAYLFARRTDVPTAPANEDAASMENSTQATTVQSTSAHTGSTTGEPASAGVSAAASSSESAAALAGSSATAAQPGAASTATTAANDDAAPNAPRAAPAMSDEEQSLAAEVGDTRRATAAGSGNTE